MAAGAGRWRQPWGLWGPSAAAASGCPTGGSVQQGCDSSCAQKQAGRQAGTQRSALSSGCVSWPCQLAPGRLHWGIKRVARGTTGQLEAVTNGIRVSHAVPVLEAQILLLQALELLCLPLQALF